MFLDCTHKRIVPSDELAVAIKNRMFHGIILDPGNFPEYTCKRDEELLFIECMYLESPAPEDFLQLLKYKSKKKEKKVLDNVLIYARHHKITSENEDGDTRGDYTVIPK